MSRPKWVKGHNGQLRKLARVVARMEKMRRNDMPKAEELLEEKQDATE